MFSLEFGYESVNTFDSALGVAPPEGRGAWRFVCILTVIVLQDAMLFLRGNVVQQFEYLSCHN